jgi:hypothetical protein
VNAVNGESSGRGSEVAHATLRGAVAAMAMTGMRAFTVDLGIVEQTPPAALDHLLYGLVLSEGRKRPQETM